MTDLNKMRDKITDFRQLEKYIFAWADEREIFEKSCTIAQAGKTIEEANEVEQAILAGETHESILTEIGDVGVTLILQAAMHGSTLHECIEKAYRKIKNRTGEIRNGVFVKDRT